MTNDYLRVSETFHSLQGEGPTVGRPSLFLRLQHCNLLCGQGDANWTCDTIEVWRQGKAQHIEQLVKHWQQQGWLARLSSHSQLVVTGGEPLLQQTGLTRLFEYLHQHGYQPAIEIETNSTIGYQRQLDRYVSRYNCSPKGANSGNSRGNRHRPEVLSMFSKNPKAIFKFVIATVDDFQQIRDEYIDPYKLSPRRIWLMPAADSRVQLNRVAGMVFKLCTEHALNYSPRLQIEVWDQTTGI